MRIAVISDLHGNLEAARRLWNDIEEADRIFCLGDTVGIGPDPREVLEMVLDDDRVTWVMGNHEINTRDMKELGPLDHMPRRPHHDWVRKEIGDLISRLDAPMSASLSICDKDLCFMHRHPDDCGSKVPYYDRPFPEVLDDFYSNIDADILFFGHTHIPMFVRGSEGRTYINPGSVGTQNGGIGTYVMVDDMEGSALRVTRRYVEYDRSDIVKKLKSKDVPYHKFIIRNFYEGKGFGPYTVKDI